MPSRTSFTPWRSPCRLSFFFRLPKYKIQRILFLILSGYQKRTFTGAKIIQVLMGKLSIILKLSGTIIHGTVFLISISLVDQRLDHIYHPTDFFCRQRILGCRLDIHAIHIFFALCNITLGYLIRRNAFLNRLFDDLIVYIRKIRHIIYIIAFILKISSDGIKYDHRPCISDMDKVINSRTAYVHLNFSFFQRYKFFFLSG